MRIEFCFSFLFFSFHIEYVELYILGEQVCHLFFVCRLFLAGALLVLYEGKMCG